MCKQHSVCRGGRGGGGDGGEERGGEGRGGNTRLDWVTKIFYIILTYNIILCHAFFVEIAQIHSSPSCHCSSARICLCV